MENASNALIMAGGILLAIMIITFGVVLISIFGNFTKDQEEEMAKTSVMQFNNQFLQYEGEGNTVHDIVSVINLVKDIQNQDIARVIQVRVNGRSDINENTTEQNLQNFLRDGYNSEGEPITIYECIVHFDGEGRIDRMTFR